MPERSKYLSTLTKKRMKCFKKRSLLLKKPSGHRHGEPPREKQLTNYDEN